MNLLEVFAALPRPSVEGSYAVAPNVANCRIGKTFDGFPAVLVSLANRTGAKLERRLANFAYRPPSSVVIRSGESETRSHLAIVECCTKERRLAQYFFRIVAEILMPEAESGDEQRFEAAIDAVITLFRALQLPAQQTIQGLWAELAIILFAEDTDTTLKSWHTSPRALHDFTNGQCRLEVKSSITKLRAHKFKLDQLRLADDGQVLIASLMMTESSDGQSISNLMTLIGEKVPAEARRKLEVVVTDSLGSIFLAGDEHLYDLEAARASLLFFRAQDVPACSPGPATVTDVSFTSDISSVVPVPLTEARALAPQFGQLLPLS